MSTEEHKSKKSLRLGRIWVVVIVINVVVFVGARQLHPGGIRGLIGDFATKSSSSPEIKALSDRMLASLVPIGAAAICLKEQGENAGLMDAAIKYNSRNEVAMQELVSEIEAAGGMSPDEKDLIDREAYRAAHDLLNRGSGAEQGCSNLAVRISSGEFDIDKTNR